MSSSELLPLAASKSSPSKPKKKKNQLGTINGVFVPCLLDILGTVLFLRIGFSVGEAGLIGTLGVFALSEVIAVLTVLSLSALASNGRMPGGGSYYLISRSLGPAFGGAVGVLFYISYAVGVSFYIVSFAGAVATTIGYDATKALPSTDAFVVLGIGSFSLFVLLIVSCCGAGCFAKINIGIFLVLFASIMYTIIYLFASGDKTTKHCENPDGVFPNATGYCDHHWPSVATLKLNLYPELDARPQCESDTGNTMCTWHQLFSIIFPAVTGIMEGANLSGDLKNPAKSIGLGTISGIILSLAVYVALMLAIAMSFDRFVLKDNMSAVQDAVGWGGVVLTGIGAATLSSALGSLFGSARVLQAIARDELFPKFLGFVGKGSGPADEPRVAVFITWAIAQGCLFLGTLDRIAPLITNFFLTSYCFTNLACFLLQTVATPNFRPTFRLFAAPLSLFGFLLSISVMFYLSWYYALTTLLCMALIFIYITLTHAPKWDDVGMALSYQQVRKYLLSMRRGETVLALTPDSEEVLALAEDEDDDESEARLFGRKPTKFAEAKFWRPQVMVLLRAPRCATLHFCNALKMGGLYVIATPFVAEDIRTLQSGVQEDHMVDPHQQESIVSQTRSNWFKLIDAMKMKAFVQVNVAPSWRGAVQNVIICTGLGAMAPNMVVVPLESLTNCDRANDAELDDTMKSERAAEWGTSFLKHPSMLNRALNALSSKEEGPGLVQVDDGARLAQELPFTFGMSEAVGTIRDILWLRKSVVVTRLMDRLPSEMRTKATVGTKLKRWQKRTRAIVSKRRTTALSKADIDSAGAKKYVDIWHVCSEGDAPVALDAQLALRLQLGYIMSQNWGLELRLFYVCTDSQRETMLTSLDAVLHSTRIHFAAVVAHVISPSQTLDRLEPDEIGAMIASQSGRSTPCVVVFADLPPPPAQVDGAADAAYLRQIDEMTAVADLPALALVRAATDRIVITTAV